MVRTPAGRPVVIRNAGTAPLQRSAQVVVSSAAGVVSTQSFGVDLPPGSMEYIDDLTGKGHTTRITSSENRISLWLKFEDQKQHIGPLNAGAATAAKR